ncbi:MAG: BatA domain-containing protein, partial [Verrucomicrobiota bacterium]
MKSLLFSNPFGFWALLGIPAILLIHLLQRKSRKVRSSTLFLLDQLAPESAQGRRFERLRNSANLWLQLLAVLLFAWLLAGPRWQRPDSVQSAVIVLDSSASMSAFADHARKVLAEKSAALAAAAARTEWTVLESLQSRKTLYSGTDREAMLASLGLWHPDGSGHDPEPVMRAALGLVRGKGAVVFVTDHPAAVPAGVAVLAVGSPVENAGFTGLQADRESWRVLVRNYGSLPVRRTWKIDGREQGAI